MFYNSYSSFVGLDSVYRTHQIQILSGTSPSSMPPESRNSKKYQSTSYSGNKYARQARVDSPIETRKGKLNSEVGLEFVSFIVQLGMAERGDELKVEVEDDVEELEIVEL
jgi:hypothetical protein